MRRRSPDFWSGLALAALGGYIVVQARGWDYLTDDGPGPGFFPLWYGVGILACSLYLVLFGKDSPSDWRGAGRAWRPQREPYFEDPARVTNDQAYRSATVEF